MNIVTYCSIHSYLQVPQDHRIFPVPKRQLEAFNSEAVLSSSLLKLVSLEHAFVA